MFNDQLFHVNFGYTKGSEINNIHLGIIFKLPKISNMVLCIPLTSPKEKHFKTKDDYSRRNHNALKYQNLVYINLTDSIALLDQIRTISTKRLLHTYKDADNNEICLNNDNLKLINIRIIKYFKNIFI